jgi:hypothetical protein
VLEAGGNSFTLAMPTSTIANIHPSMNAIEFLNGCSVFSNKITPMIPKGDAPRASPSAATSPRPLLVAINGRQTPVLATIRPLLTAFVSSR